MISKHYEPKICDLLEISHDIVDAFIEPRKTIPN